MLERRIVELVEGGHCLLTRDVLDDAHALKLFRTEDVELAYPSPATEFRYRLTAGTTIGQIPVGQDLLLRIAPKVSVGNVFRMLEVAYNLKSFRTFHDVVSINSVEDIFERLASILARRVLDRARRGLYRDYMERADDLPYVCGRLDVRKTIRRMLSSVPRVHCEYQENTPDVEANQIILWTLTALLCLGLERAEVAQEVRAARRALLGSVTVTPFRGADCVGRLYNRLNDDYEPLHGICRFVLENCGPGVGTGEHRLVPFTINMPRLFELFVAEWLRSHLPSHLRIKPQHKVSLDSTGRLSFKIDLVLFDAIGTPLAILDTKYKKGELPSEEDIQQVVAYAVQMGVAEALLVYPTAAVQGIDVKLGPVHSIRVRSVIFDIGEKLDKAGTKVVELLAGIGE